MFGPLSQRLRGRWEANKIVRFPISENSGLAGLMDAAPEIPGMYIWIDLEKRSAGAKDPLECTESGKRIMAKIQSHYKQVESAVVSPAEPIEITGMTDDQIKDFLYWMRRSVDDGHAVAVANSPELPPMEKIKQMPGRRTLNHAFPTTNPETRQFEEPYEFFVPAK
ncbi:MAG: hypothetical protein CMK32_09905 [Porticoccaceae bacterium]|nr:hypothetical protein [Porticoccaceae bacterium]